MQGGEIVFDEVQIGRGLRPIAQHGFVVVTPETITLLGSDRQQIDSAPTSAVTAKKVPFTHGKTVTIMVNGTKYNVSPGWGARPGPWVFPGETKDVKTAGGALVHLIANGGRL